jgi:transposase, IS5 family
VNADAKHKLIRQYVTEARGHDSQKSDGLLNHANTSADVYADSAYRSAETDGKLNPTCAACAAAFISARAAIIRHPRRGRTRTAGRAKFGTPIEHVFGIQQTSPGGRIVRTIGIARAKAKIGLQNLAYRLVTLERMAAASGRSVPGAPKERPVHKTKHIRDNSNNDRRAAPVIDPGKTSSLFEVPSINGSVYAIRKP